MPTVNEILARFVLFVLRILGNKQVSLKQVKAALLLNELKDKLISQVRATLPADDLRIAFVQDIETCVKNALLCLHFNFTPKNWSVVVSEMRLHCLIDQEEMIDSYAIAVMREMVDSDIERARHTLEAQAADKIAAMNAELFNSVQLEEVHHQAHESMINAMKACKNK